MRTGLRGALLTGLGLLLLGLGSARAGEPPVLRVFAAASLTEVAETLAEGFGQARVQLSLGGSSALARQIRDGAPADVFLSADSAWMDFLDEAGLLAGHPRVLARNRLVCIATQDAALARAGVQDARALLEALGGSGRLAIADEGVPAGEYARAALRSLGLLAAYRPHMVGQRDVRAVLFAVERGALPAGFVYATDARVAEVRTLFDFAPGTHPPIEYQAGVLTGSADREVARLFLDYLKSPPARALFVQAGFSPP